MAAVLLVGSTKLCHHSVSNKSKVMTQVDVICCFLFDSGLVSLCFGIFFYWCPFANVRISFWFSCFLFEFGVAAPAFDCLKRLVSELMYYVSVESEI